MGSQTTVHAFCVAKALMLDIRIFNHFHCTAMLLSTIGFYNVIPVSVTLSGAEGQKDSANRKTGGFFFLFAFVVVAVAAVVVVVAATVVDTVVQQLRIEMDIVLKQLKSSILILLLSVIYRIKGPNCCNTASKKFTFAYCDWVK